MSRAKALPAPPALRSAAAARPARLVVPNGTLEAIKWLALVLMTLTHVDKYLFGEKLPFCFAAGRMVMPLFAAVLGYNLARPGMLQGGYRRTLARLVVAGLVSCVPYIALGNVLWGWWPLNILAALAVATATLWLWELGGAGRRLLASLVFLLGGAVVEFWWPALVLVIGAWAYTRRPTIGRAAVFAAACAALWIINRNSWALAALPILALAPHVELRVPRHPLVFYVYYPAHLAALWLVVALR
jgi:hypothetical protein